ncbi:MAG: cation transporter, partial [Leptolyngbyaceae cyanobacterium SM2_5_2]|nr:cation transporter [Leptolyngbyaceae cyanobacterium SM2_5_2]
MAVSSYQLPPLDHRSTVQRVLLITLGLNLLVVALKATVGWLTGSLSLMADALHSITDSANNILGLTTNRLADPHPDRNHPYGHQKYEAIGALGIAAFLGIACFEILTRTIERLISGSNPVEVGPTALVIMLIVLGINTMVAIYERQIGQALGSKILLADARHTLSDIWTTVVVIAGLIGVSLGWQWLDVTLAFPVAL